MRLSLLDRLLGRDVDEAARDYIAALRPHEQIEEALAEALAAVEEARMRKVAVVSGRKYTPPIQPRPVVRTAVPKD